MKKNININLFGTLYAIDEDACKLLENYLDNMKSYFAKREGGDEIVDDIEHRVAEHLWSLKEQGQDAIDIETVKQIIRNIGDPAEVDGVGDDAENSAEDAVDDSETNATDDTSEAGSHEFGDKKGRFESVLHHVKTHRFYRDGKDKIAGGVISGLRYYCGGGDLVVWRVCAVLLVIAAITLANMNLSSSLNNFFGFLIALPLILYVVLWLLAPVARTAEERLCMTGEEVTPESISRAVIAEVDEENKTASSRQGEGSIMSRLVEIVTFCAKSAALVAFAVMTAFSLAYLVGGVVYSIVGDQFILLLFDNSPDISRILSSIQLLSLYWIISAICCLVAALLPLLGLVRSFNSHSKPLGIAATATLIGTWIVAVTVGILMFVLFGIQAEKESDIIERQQNTRNGVYLNRWSWDYLYEKGWTLNDAGNIKWGMLFADSYADPLELKDQPFHIKPEKQGKPLTLSLSRKQSVVAGEYKLECMTICTAKDATLSVWRDDKCLAMLRLDGFGTANGRMLKDVSWADSRAIPLFCEQGDSTTWVDNVSQRKDNWQYLESKPFHHDGGILEYRLQIGQHDVKDATTVNSEVWMAHESVRKQ